MSICDDNVDVSGFEKLDHGGALRLEPVLDIIMQVFVNI
jgi:hypothetical protein